MTTDDAPAGQNGSMTSLADMVRRLKESHATTSAERTSRDALLDRLQDAVGLTGRMTTERDILCRADAMLRKP